MSSAGVYFDMASAVRIGTVVRAYERTGVAETGGGPSAASTHAPFWARLLNECTDSDGAGTYNWVMQNLVNGQWQDVTDSSTGHLIQDDQNFTAYEENFTSGITQGTRVQLTFRCYDTSNTDGSGNALAVYTFAYASQGPFVGTLTKDGGSDGSPGVSAATWTYTISRNGQKLATGVPVQKSRLLADNTTPATKGLILYVPAGSSDCTPGGTLYSASSSSSSGTPYQPYAIWDCNETYTTKLACVPGASSSSSSSSGAD